jgi:glutamate racemase
MIGILDWGVGGLGFLKALRQRHPRLPVIYWSDAGETPYGKLPSVLLAARVRAVAERLAQMGARRIVVACHAASTVLPALGIADTAGVIQTAAGPVELTGVIAHALQMVRDDVALRIGVIGGRRTIRSGIYRRALATPGRAIHQRVAQPLSARVEAGDLTSADLRRELAEILRPLRDVEALLLACTHYPALASPIAQQLPGVRLLDPVERLLAWVSTHWRRAAAGADHFVTTGDPRAMRHAAAAAFGVRLVGVRRIGLVAPRPPVPSRRGDPGGRGRPWRASL